MANVTIIVPPTQHRRRRRRQRRAHAQVLTTAPQDVVPAAERSAEAEELSIELRVIEYCTPTSHGLVRATVKGGIQPYCISWYFDGIPKSVTQNHDIRVPPRRGLYDTIIHASVQDARGDTADTKGSPFFVPVLSE